jgi:hypothetical protein
MAAKKMAGSAAESLRISIDDFVADLTGLFRDSIMSVVAGESTRGAPGRKKRKKKPGPKKGSKRRQTKALRKRKARRKVTKKKSRARRKKR